MDATIIVNGREYRIVREPTSNKHASAFVDGSTIRVRIPTSWPREEGFKAFLKLEKRMLRKLEANPRTTAKEAPIVFSDGQEVTLMGRRFKLVKTLGRGESSSARLEGENVIIRLSPGLSQDLEREAFSNLARRVMASALHSIVHERVRKLGNEHFQTEPERLFIKDNLSNHGSCSQKKNINLSFRLLFAPEPVLDYVIIHELAHLKEPNHSPAFWALVEKAVPDYKERVQWLKQNTLPPTQQEQSIGRPDAKLGPRRVER